MEAYSIQGAPVTTGDTEPEDRLQKSILNGEESAPGLCQNCASLPEVVVTGERINDNRQEGIQINGYWGAGTSSLSDLGIIQQQPVGGTVPFLPGGIGGWGNIKNFFGIFKNLSNFFKASKTSNWMYGGFKSSTKWGNQLAKRGWTEKQITEAISKGKSFNAVNDVNKANTATRYVHPQTGQSVVIDDVTKELLHVGGPGFKY